jgi:predicted ester cyclase
MKTEINTELKNGVEKYVEAWNTGNVDILDAAVAPNFTRRMSFAARTAADSLASLKEVILSHRASFPDFHVELQEVIYLENKTVSRYKYSGTNTGPGAIPPTGKIYSGTGISITNFKNGKAVEEWAELDNLAAMIQLGFTLTPPE